MPEVTTFEQVIKADTERETVVAPTWRDAQDRLVPDPPTAVEKDGVLPGNWLIKEKIPKLANTTS